MMLFKSPLGAVLCSSLFLCQYLVHVQADADDISQCDKADWGASLDRTGWSVCPQKNTYLKGLWRHERKWGDERVGRIEYGRCCPALEEDFANQPAVCSNANWRSTLDGNNVWALCPGGYFLNGVYKSNGQKLYNIEEGQCCRPQNQEEDDYDDCYDEDVSTSFDNAAPYKGPCGQVKLAKRILGGQHASPGEWPWHVQLNWRGYAEAQYCSGSLLTPEWIITAAHCVEDQGIAEIIGIVLGDLDIKTNSGTEQIFRASKFIKHPLYNTEKTGLAYDFALLKLPEPAIMNDHVQPVCLPESSEKLPVGTVCWETGWGLTTHDGKMSEHLKELEVIVEDPKLSPHTVHETMFITKTNTKGHGTCRGDSGGPVVHERDGTWYLEGVHSWGRPSCGQEGYYDGQADVRTVLKWIKDTMSNN
ncbi:hypothetical protein ACROYT_G036842 [Oculina patagonica]